VIPVQLARREWRTEQHLWVKTGTITANLWMFAALALDLLWISRSPLDPDASEVLSSVTAPAQTQRTRRRSKASADENRRDQREGTER
jgi:hypothetical protein